LRHRLASPSDSRHTCHSHRSMPVPSRSHSRSTNMSQ
jgi:hypothetical protein